MGSYFFLSRVIFFNIYCNFVGAKVLEGGKYDATPWFELTRLLKIPILSSYEREAQRKDFYEYDSANFVFTELLLRKGRSPRQSAIVSHIFGLLRTNPNASGWTFTGVILGSKALRADVDTALLCRAPLYYLFDSSLSFSR